MEGSGADSPADRERDRDISRRQPIDGSRALEQVPNSDIQADTAGKAHPSSSGNRILADLTDRAAVRTLEA
jgi:hypothetical protein